MNSGTRTIKRNKTITDKTIDHNKFSNEPNQAKAKPIKGKFGKLKEMPLKAYGPVSVLPNDYMIKSGHWEATPTFNKTLQAINKPKSISANAF
jgi:hypothetical protein